MAPRATGLRWLTLWLGIILLAVSARQTGLLERADSWRQDRYVRTFTPGSYDSSVVIVDLTDGVAPWPWPRATLARLLDRLLNVAHVKAVVLDVVLSGQPLGGGDAGGFQQANQQIAELVARARTRDRPQTVVFALSGTLVPEGRSPGAGLAGSGAAGSGAAGSGAAGSGAAGSGAADSGAADSGAADSGAIGSTPASASHAAADAGQLPDLRYHLCIDPDNLPPPELRDVPRGFAVLLAPHFYGGQVRQAPLVATPELPDGSSPYCPPVAGASSVAEMVNAVLPMPPVLLSLAAAGAAGGGWPGIDAHAHQVRLGDRWIGTDDRYRIEIPYIDESFPAVIDAAEVLSDAPRGQAALERLRDKVTVIGRHVSEKWDYRPTAWGHRTGVSIQAGIVSALVSGETRHRTDPLLDLALQIVGLAVAGLVLRKLDRALPRLLGALGLLGLMVGVEIIALTGYHVWLDGPVLELSILTTLALRSVLVTTSARSKQPQKT